MNSDLYFEIFEKFEKAEKRADKIEILRKNGDNNFIQFLIMAFNPEVGQMLQERINSVP